MKSFVKSLAAAAVAIGLGTGAALAQDAVKFGVADENYPPFSSKDASGKWVGWEMELMDMVCAKAGLKCELVPTAWDGIIPALQAKKIDVIWSSMSITAERKEKIDFTSMYYDSAAVIIGPKDGNKDIAPDSLKGKKIGVQVATIHARYMEKHYAGSEIKAYQKQDDANADLAAGRIDAIMADGIALGAFLDTDQGKACCEMKGQVAADPAILGDGVGGGLRKEDDELEGKINAALSELAKSGEIAALTKKYNLEGGIVTPTM